MNFSPTWPIQTQLGWFKPDPVLASTTPATLTKNTTEKLYLSTARLLAITIFSSALNSNHNGHEAELGVPTPIRLSMETYEIFRTIWACLTPSKFNTNFAVMNKWKLLAFIYMYIWIFPSIILFDVFRDMLRILDVIHFKVCFGTSH